MTTNYRKFLFNRPYDTASLVVPVTLSDATQGYLPAKPLGRRGSLARRLGLLLHRALRDHTSTRQKLVARGDRWVVSLPDGTRYNKETFYSLEEARVWAAALNETQPEAATAALREHRAAIAAKRQAEEDRRKIAQQEAAGALGLRPWYMAEPIYREAAQDVLRWTAGRTLQDCTEIVLVNGQAVSRKAFLANRENFLERNLEIWSTEGFHRPM